MEWRHEVTWRGPCVCCGWIMLLLNAMWCLWCWPGRLPGQRGAAALVIINAHASSAAAQCAPPLGSRLRASAACWAPPQARHPRCLPILRAPWERAHYGREACAAGGGARLDLLLLSPRNAHTLSMDEVEGVVVGFWRRDRMRLSVCLPHTARAVQVREGFTQLVAWPPLDVCCLLERSSSVVPAAAAADGCGACSAVNMVTSLAGSGCRIQRHAIHRGSSSPESGAHAPSKQCALQAEGEPARAQGEPAAFQKWSRALQA